VNQEDQDRLARAVSFALMAHGDQTRKGNDIPYVSHLLQVAGLVLEHGGSVELAVAGLLHDVAEDCEDFDVARIEREFGPEVARIVALCTDTLPGDSPQSKSPWQDRKRHYLDQIAGADDATKLVVACDKLHNLRSIVADLDQEGVETLDRFTASREQTCWYYDSVRGRLQGSIPQPLSRSIDEAYEKLCEYVRGASEGG
jgi:(p)ppGpp synthase/HD superfamily hydrolase